MEKKLEPHWGGLVAAISFLYALWAAANFHASQIHGHQEAGVLAMYIILFMLFFFVMALAVFPVGWLFIWIEGFLPRICIALLALGIFLVGYGKPSLLVIGITALIFWSGYDRCKKAREDTDDLEDFLEK